MAPRVPVTSRQFTAAMRRASLAIPDLSDEVASQVYCSGVGQTRIDILLIVGVPYIVRTLRHCDSFRNMSDEQLTTIAKAVIAACNELAA